MDASDTDGERQRDLAAIQHAYDRYESEGRYRLWDVSNPGYARMVRDRDRVLVRLLRASVPRANARILDLGCGDGRLASVARDGGVSIGQWTGVDLSGEAVDVAAARNPLDRFVVASVDDLAFESESFDVAIASTLFSSLPSRSFEIAAAREVSRVLVRGGWLIWYDLRYDNPRNPDVHGVSLADLGQFFPGWRRELEPMTLMPPLARRLGAATPVLYPPLHGIRALRSHLAGRLQRPSMPQAGR